MISLEKFSALPISMKEDYSLVFGEGMVSEGTNSPNVREFTAERNYLKDPTSDYGRKDVYHMYRKTMMAKDTVKIERAHVQYDITVIPPGKFGDEYAKTIGHYHPFKKGTQVRFPEVYEVIYGKVFWLIQRATPDLEQLEEVYVIEAERGEKAIIPPGFGHVSINPTDDVVVMANWQPMDNKGIYEPYEAHQGGAYYMVETERLSESGKTSKGYEFVPNLHHKSLPELRHVRPRELPQFDFRSALPMYFTGVKDLSTIDFLNNPEQYLEEIAPDKIFLDV